MLSLFKETILQGGCFFFLVLSSDRKLHSSYCTKEPNEIYFTHVPVPMQS